MVVLSKRKNQEVRLYNYYYMEILDCDEIDLNFNSI